MSQPNKTMKPPPILDIAWWLPLLRKQDFSSNSHRNELLISVGALFSTPLCLFYAIDELYLGYPTTSVMLAFGSLFSLIIYITTRIGRYHIAYSRCLIGYFLALILFQVLQDRGQFTLFHLFLIPPLTFFLFGTKEGLIWSLTALFAMLPILVLPDFFGVKTLAGGEPDFVGVYTIIMIFAGIFETFRDRAQVRFETQQRQLVAEHEELLGAQSRLTSSEQRFRAFSELASDWLFEMDENLTYTFATPRLNEIVGEQVVGQSVRNLSIKLEGDGNALNAMVHGGVITNEQISFRNLQGQRIVALFNAMPTKNAAGEFTGYIGAGKDITAIQEAQESIREKDQTLHHLQKLEALDQLTSGVAHDFNNLLTVIAGNLELMDWNAVATEDKEKLLAVSKTVDRAAALTSQLLSFSRKQDLKPEPVVIGTLVTRLSEMFSRTLGSSITIHQAVSENLNMCLIDEGQLENAVLNLVLNARDAMSGRGDITITAKNVTITESEPADLKPGKYVALSVQDTGIGMDDEQLSRIMEPFYTTKPVGEGTGLGLSMAYGFARQSGGLLTVNSKPNQGSTFTLYLPKAAKTPLAQPSQNETPSSDGISRQILLIEDEPEVQKVLIQSLQRGGYQVEAFSAAEPALDYLQTQTPDLIISDLMLGNGMNGAELAEQVHADNPTLPLLLISGNADHVLSKKTLEKHSNSLLRKPFTSAQLRNAVEKLLVSE